MACRTGRTAAFARHRALGYDFTMLLIKPNCECCNGDLMPDSKQAWICSFECTFCSHCVTTRLNGVCPNCNGELVRRPVRPAGKLEKFPASTTRKIKPLGCAAA